MRPYLALQIDGIEMAKVSLDHVQHRPFGQAAVAERGAVLLDSRRVGVAPNGGRKQLSR